MKNIYEMTRYESLTYAKPLIVELVYNSAKLEGLAVTYTETEQIVNRGMASNISIFDINVIVNIHRAYKYILDNDLLNYPYDLSTLLRINAILGKVRGDDDLWYMPGEVRVQEVKIRGSVFPPLPNAYNVKYDLQDICNSEKSEREIGIDLFLYVTKSQIFSDGNKRTATVFANHYLLSKGIGLIFIDEKDDMELRKLLVEYYDSNNDKPIKNFMYKNCIKGMIKIQETN